MNLSSSLIKVKLLRSYAKKLETGKCFNMKVSVKRLENHQSRWQR